MEAAFGRALARRGSLDWAPVVAVLVAAESPASFVARTPEGRPGRAGAGSSSGAVTKADPKLRAISLGAAVPTAPGRSAAPSRDRVDVARAATCLCLAPERSAFRAGTAAPAGRAVWWSVAFA